MAASIKGKQFISGTITFDISTDQKDGCQKSIDIIDTLEVGALQAIALDNKIPVEPFDKRLLKPVLKGIVQSEWYKAVKGAIPQACALSQKARVDKYKLQLAELTNVSEFDLVGKKPRKAKSTEPKTPRVANFYRYIKGVDMEKVNEGRGQYKMVAVALQGAESRPKIGRGLTAAEVVIACAAMVEIAKFVKPPSDTNTAFHLNALVNEGFVEAVNGEGEVQARKEKKTKAEAPAAK